MAGEVEESAYFGEGEGDKSSVYWWCGVRVGSVGGLGALVLTGPPFLAWCAVMVRNEWVSMARVMCRCQALYFRTWYSSSPTSFLLEPKHSSMGQREPATFTSSPNPARFGLWQW